MTAVPSTSTVDATVAPGSATTGPPGPVEKAILGTFVAVPLAALVVGVPIALLNGWVTWLDLAMLAVIYVVGVHGITIGYHPLFTHSAFTAGRRMRAVLALAGSLAVEGRVVDWVADHRKHHKFSDVDGDPHSPWEYGPGARGLTRGSSTRTSDGSSPTRARTPRSTPLISSPTGRSTRISRLWHSSR